MKATAKAKKQTRAPKVRPETKEEVDVQRSNWRSALITGEQHTHNVSLRALTTDYSTLAGSRGSDHTKLWEVAVDIEHQQPAPSVYLNKNTRTAYANPDDDAFVTLTIGCPRGDLSTGREIGKVEPQATVIRCQLGHIDALVLALSNALIIGRRDGTFPVVRGMKSFSVSTISAMGNE